MRISTPFYNLDNRYIMNIYSLTIYKISILLINFNYFDEANTFQESFLFFKNWDLSMQALTSRKLIFLNNDLKRRIKYFTKSFKHSNCQYKLLFEKRKNLNKIRNSFSDYISVSILQYKTYFWWYCNYSLILSISS